MLINITFKKNSQIVPYFVFEGVTYGFGNKCNKKPYRGMLRKQILDGDHVNSYSFGFKKQDI